jgi:phenylalanyl-tRNA synthetase alpha chain
VVIPGWVYRKDTFDASHAPVFAQIEGLAVDEGISFIDLKATLSHFAHEFFGSSTQVRFRLVVLPLHRAVGGDGRELWRVRRARLSCLQGHRVDGDPRCRDGAPQRAGQLRVDPERYTGFAFGMGPQRIALNRYGIPDIRLLYEGDMRFLEQLAR